MRNSAFRAGVICVIVLLIAACGGHSYKSRVSGLALQPASTGMIAGILPAELQAEIDALIAPPGCNATLFYHLKKSFVQALTVKFASGEKLASAPPMGDGNIVHGLTMTQDGGVYTLHWPYHNTGDYDQSGTVGITDITPIAMHFGHTTGTDPLDIVIDGDGLGSVGISDITPLAMNFGVNLVSYRVEEAADEAGPYTALGNVPLTAGTGADQGWMRLEFALPDDSARWLRVVPIDNESVDGVPSDAINFGGAGSLPEIVSVSPLQGALGSSVTFQAVVNGLGPFTYDWQFFDAAAPASSAEEQPLETLSLGPSGEYNCSLTVSNASGSDSLDFIVAIGNPPIVTDVAPVSGLAGSSAQFVATVSGDAPFTYEWNFASGAVPDTSTDESPNVTLGLPGIYDMASVSVSNAYGTVLYPFMFTVYSSLDPPVILNAGPVQVHAGDVVTFSANISGAIPMAYSWDFGDAATPSTSFDSNPTVVITDTLTTFPIGLQVSNYNGADTYDFDLKVIDPALYDETEPNDDIASANPLPAFPIAGWHCRLSGGGADPADFFSFTANTGDRIQVTQRLDGVDPFLGLMLSDSFGNPLTSAESESPVKNVLDFTFGASGTYYLMAQHYGYDSIPDGDYWLDIMTTQRTLDEVEDNDYLGQANEIHFPLVDFYGSIGVGGYDGDDDDFFVFDASPGALVLVYVESNSWTTSVAGELQDSMGTVLVTSEIDGSIGYVIQPSDTGPFFLHITPDTGSGLYILNGTVEASTLWQTNVVDDSTSVDLGEWASLTVLSNGHPGSIYYDSPNTDVYFAYSDSLDGLGSWTITPVDVGVQNVGYWLSGGMINGKPAAAYLLNDTSELFFAMCPNADGSGVWNVTSVDTSGHYDPSVAEINGLPAVAYETDSSDLWFGINSDMNAAGVWTTYPVTASGDGAYYTSLIALSGGYPGASYAAHNVDEVRFASCDAIDGSGTWSYSTVHTNAGGCTCAALINGYPAVLYRNNDDDCLWYSINSSYDGMGTWSHSKVSEESIGGYPSLMANGNPVIIYPSNNGTIYYAENSQMDGLGEWTNQIVVLYSDTGSNRALGFVNGKLACMYASKTTPSTTCLSFATPSGS